uniref:Uncharacterized protein n=1 Tax=Moschus moschiferus TaxID=68415 RepID=A0A8C6CKU0_MOSMO
MKGTLLVLVLLVTRELTFETSEACPMFSAAFSSMALGSKTLLNSTLSLVDATDAENEAIGRIQDCFNEAGFDDKLLNIESMVIYSPHPYPALPTNTHSAVCHMVIDHEVIGYVADKSYKQRST